MKSDFFYIKDKVVDLNVMNYRVTMGDLRLLKLKLGLANMLRYIIAISEHTF